MNGDKEKAPQPQDREASSLGWFLFFMTVPEYWIPGLIAFLAIHFVGIPEEIGPAIFVVSFIVLLMLASGFVVYRYGRSFKRGKTNPGRSHKRRG